MIDNVHERFLPCTLDQAWESLTDIEAHYPGGGFQLPEGLSVGAPVKHMGQTYRVGTLEPGRKLWFAVSPKFSHGFTLHQAEGGVLIRHEMRGTLPGVMRLLWPIVIRRAHDRTLEQLLDSMERRARDVHAG
ncbi:hypothetical protein OIE66_30880 [Nonomuraea sp. NBC_01738]|uniref:hypothetical protein n=1 Tax=Nonomuraea sp. NBC_01738 TaxID=2976003 RepID=UPI002E0F6E89|nr:hypothetical protein OIE66_30880 [Nonomuraea sp. NBC_01738]